KSLKTSDINVARAARWNALDLLKREIASARADTDTALDPFLREAVEFRDLLAKADHKERDDLLYEIVNRAEQIDREDSSVSGSLAPSDEGYEDITSKRATDFAKLA